MATVKVDQVAAYAVLQQPALLKLDQIAAYAVLSSPPTDPFTVEVQQHIVNSINVTWQKSFVLADLTFGVPSAVVKDRFNAKLPVTFKPSSGYRGSLDFAYYRFPLKEIVRDRDLDTLKYDKVMTATNHVVQRFNATFGTALSASDFKVAPIPQDGPCTLEASDNSLYFQPGTKVNVGWMCPSDRDWELVGLAWPTTLAALPAYFAKAAFVTQLGTLLGRTLTPASVTFADTASLSTSPASIREIKRDVTYPSVDGQSTVTKQVFYNRVDLAGMSAFAFPTTTKVLEDTTIHHILPAINAITGIPFTIYDLEDLPVAAQDSLTTFTLTLQAKASSPLFKGTYTLTVGRKPALSTVFTSLSLGSV